VRRIAIREAFPFVTIAYRRAILDGVKPARPKQCTVCICLLHLSLTPCSLKVLLVLANVIHKTRGACSCLVFLVISVVARHCPCVILNHISSIMSSSISSKGTSCIPPDPPPLFWSFCFLSFFSMSIYSLLISKR